VRREKVEKTAVRICKPACLVTSKAGRNYGIFTLQSLQIFYISPQGEKSAKISKNPRERAKYLGCSALRFHARAKKRIYSL
jgi:hypothetical protein